MQEQRNRGPVVAGVVGWGEEESECGAGDVGEPECSVGGRADVGAGLDCGGADCGDAAVAGPGREDGGGDGASAF